MLLAQEEGGSKAEPARQDQGGEVSAEHVSLRASLAPDDEAKESVAEHLRRCPACRVLAEEQGRLAHLLARLAPPFVEEPTPSTAPGSTAPTSPVSTSPASGSKLRGPGDGGEEGLAASGFIDSDGSPPQAAPTSSSPGAASDGRKEELFAQLQVELQRERGLLSFWRNLSTVVRRSLVLAFSVLLCLGVLLAAPRVDLGSYPWWRMVLLLLLFGGGFTGAGWFLLRPLYRPAWPRWLIGLLALLVGLALPVGAALLPEAKTHHPTSLGGQEVFWLAAAKCFFFGLGLALPLLLLLLLLSRKTHLRLPVALLASLTGGLLANAALQLHCPLVDPWHLLAGHATTGLGLALLVGIAGGLFWLLHRKNSKPRRPL